MSHLITSLTWCWVQLFLVAAVAIGLSLLALRRSPAAGATIAWSGVVATLVLTGLAIVPFPALVGQRSLGDLIVRKSQGRQTENSEVTQRSPVERAALDETGFRVALNGPLFTKLLQSLRTSESVVVRHHNTTRWVLVVVAIGSAIGLLRLIGGLLAIAALRQRAEDHPKRLFNFMGHFFKLAGAHASATGTGSLTTETKED
jgi:hypothetical protein